MAGWLDAVEDPFFHGVQEPLPLGMTQSDGCVAWILRITDHDGLVGRGYLGTLAAFARGASTPHPFASSPAGHLTPNSAD